MIETTKEEVVEIPFPQREYNTQEIVVIDLNAFSKKAGHIASLPHRIKFYQILFITQGEGIHWVDFEPLS
jgi:AraC family transcriptional regulator, transcriptional activator of pobA